MKYNNQLPSFILLSYIQNYLELYFIREMLCEVYIHLLINWTQFRAYLLQWGQFSDLNRTQFYAQMERFKVLSQMKIQQSYNISIRWEILKDQNVSNVKERFFDIGLISALVHYPIIISKTPLCKNDFFFLLHARE